MIKKYLTVINFISQGKTITGIMWTYLIKQSSYQYFSFIFLALRMWVENPTYLYALHSPHVNGKEFNDGN